MILRFLIYCLLLSTSIVLFAQEETYLFRKEFCDSLLSSCKGRDVCNTNGKNIIFGTVWNEVVDSIYLYARELDDQGNPLELKVLKKAILSGEWSTPYEIAIDGSRLEYHDNHYFMVYGHQYNPETDRWRIGVIKVNRDLETV